MQLQLILQSLKCLVLNFPVCLAEHWKVLHFLLRHYNELVHNETFWKNKLSVIREQDGGNLAILNGHRKNNVVMMCGVYWSEGCDWKAERRAWETRAGHYNWIPMGKNMMDKASTLWLHPFLHLISICSELHYWLSMKILLKRLLYGQTQWGHFSLQLQTNWDQIRGTWDGSSRNQLAHMLWWCHWQAIGEQTSFRLRSQETWDSTAAHCIFTESVVYHSACRYKLGAEFTKDMLWLTKV